jgi:hypothetical protein
MALVDTKNDVAMVLSTVLLLFARIGSAIVIITR